MLPIALKLLRTVSLNIIRMILAIFSLILIQRSMLAPMAQAFILLFEVLLILSHFSHLPVFFFGALTGNAATVLLVALESDIFGSLLVATSTDKGFCYGAHSH